MTPPESLHQQGSRDHAASVLACGVRRGSKPTPRHVGGRRLRPFVKKEDGHLDVRAFISGPRSVRWSLRLSVCPRAQPMLTPTSAPFRGRVPVLWPLHLRLTFRINSSVLTERPLGCA